MPHPAPRAPLALARLRRPCLALTLVGAALLLACGGERGRAGPTGPGDGESRGPPAVERAWRGEGPLLLVSVWEMHCPGCEIEVEDALKAVPGVAAVRADWETSEVRIELDGAARREQVIDAVRAALHAQERLVVGEDPVGR